MELSKKLILYKGSKQISRLWQAG